MSDRPKKDAILDDLEQPPIAEVVCGVEFAPIASLDPFEFGLYWQQRSRDFPHRKLQPAVVSGGFRIELAGGSMPMRAVLTSANDEIVQQIQSDRFYLNWRRRGSQYPRFSDHGNKRGLRSRATEEFRLLSEFCETRPTIRARPKPVRTELRKIDIFVRGQHWSDAADLERLLPMTAPFLEIGETQDLKIFIQVHQPTDDGEIAATITSKNTKDGLEAIKLETSISVPIDEQGADAALSKANARLNAIFLRIVPDAQERFGRKGLPSP